MSTLVDEFVDALDALDLPTTDLTPAVLSTLGSAEAVDTSEATIHVFTPRRAVVWAAAAAVVVAVILIVPPAREAVADLLGIGATEVVIEPAEPGRAQGSSAEELGTPTPTAPSTAAAPDVTTVPATTVDPLPALGPPTGVADDPDRGRSYTWPASDELPALDGTDLGAVLSVRRVDSPISLKSVPLDVAVEPVTVETATGSVAGLWIDGPHDLLTASGTSVRAARTLLWVVDDVEFRLELDGSLDQALALAREVGEGTDLLPPG